MAHIAFLINNEAHIVSVLNDRVNRSSAAQPLALLTARIVTEETDDILVFEVPCLVAQNTFNIRADQRLVDGVKTVLGHRHASRLVDGNPADILILDLCILRREYKAEVFTVDGILDRVSETGDLLGHRRYRAQTVVSCFDVEAYARKFLLTVLNVSRRYSGH